MTPLSPDLTIETARLRLRHIERADLEPIFRATQNAEFMAGQSWRAPDDLAAMDPFFDGVVSRWREGRVSQLSCVLRSTGEFVGVVALIPQPSPAPPEDGGGDRTFHVGYFTVPEHQREGYATEALAGLIRYVFDVLQADAVLAAHALFNVASARVLERSGFRRVRVVPGGYVKDDVAHDEAIARLDRADWLATAS